MPVSFKAVLQKFDSHGDKTGWTYILVSKEIAEKIKPGVRRSFRVKGAIDKHPIAGVSMIPYGGGDFIIPVNGEMRKGIGKRKSDSVTVKLSEDGREYEMNKEFLECLKDDPAASNHFHSLLPSHQRYFSKWIESAKTEPTRIKRISLSVNALARKMGYSEMLREGKLSR